MPDKKTFVLSDGSVNSYGFAIDMEKLNLDRFNSNPVLLYNHYSLVGKWENIRLEEGKLLAEPVFMDDVSEIEALKIQKRVEQGFLKGASIGFNVLSVRQEGDDAPVVEAEIIECSIVDIPSNKNAITLYDKDGVKLEGEAFQLALKSITKPKEPKKDKEMKLSAETLIALGLKPEANETEVNASISAIVAENVKLKADAETAQKLKVDSLIKRGQDEGRFLAASADDYRELANTNFQLAERTINALPVKGKLAGKEELSGNQNQDDRADWDFAKWRKEDTAGLLSIKANDPERYKKIIGQ